MKALQWHIYVHEALDTGYNDGENSAEAGVYNIDYPVGSIDVNATNFNIAPRLSYQQWHSLPEDAWKVWNMLSPEAKEIILWPKAAPLQQHAVIYCPLMPRPNKLLPPCPWNINLHDIEHLIDCLHDLHGGGGSSDNTNETQGDDDAISAPDDSNDDQTLLAHLLKRSHYHLDTLNNFFPKLQTVNHPLDLPTMEIRQTQGRSALMELHTKKSM